MLVLSHNPMELGLAHDSVPPWEQIGVPMGYDNVLKHM